MSDFARFCSRCYAFFRDADSYAAHVEACGNVRKEATDEKKQAKPEEKRERRPSSARTTERRSQETVASNQEIEASEQAEVEGKTSDTWTQSTVSAPLPAVVTPLPADTSTRNQKFKT